MLPTLYLKKKIKSRILYGHPWVFSNEVDTTLSPLKNFQPGEEVVVKTAYQKILGVAYVNPHSLICARLFSRDPNARFNQDFIAAKLLSAKKIRERLFDRPFYRLVFSESDQLPGLIIDRYENDFIAQLNTAGMENRKEEFANAMLAIFPTLRSLFLRNDSPIRIQENLSVYSESLLGQVPLDLRLEENGLAFIAPFSEGQKTGWFFDHRFNRARLKSYVKTQRVLDVFSYIGAFGIHAGVYGAKEVLCVESSALAASYIQKNAELHQLNQLHVLCDDAFSALKALNQAHERFGVIILDPPAFIKKAKDHHAGMLAYQRINQLALKLLEPGGILISCSCSMHLHINDLISIIQKCATQLNTSLQILERGHQGYDHPLHPHIAETDYLKAIFIRKME